MSCIPRFVPWPLTSFNMVTDKRCRSHLSVTQDPTCPKERSLKLMQHFHNLHLHFLSYHHLTPHHICLTGPHYHPSLKTIITRPILHYTPVMMCHQPLKINFGNEHLHCTFLTYSRITNLSDYIIMMGPGGLP